MIEPFPRLLCIHPEKATHVHTDLDESAEAMKEALRDLLSTVETVATEAGVVSGLVDSITASMNQMESSAQTVKLRIYKKLSLNKSVMFSCISLH